MEIERLHMQINIETIVSGTQGECMCLLSFLQI